MGSVNATENNVILPSTRLSLPQTHIRKISNLLSRVTLQPSKFRHYGQLLPQLQDKTTHKLRSTVLHRAQQSRPNEKVSHLKQSVAWIRTDSPNGAAIAEVQIATRAKMMAENFMVS